MIEQDKIYYGVAAERDSYKPEKDSHSIIFECFLDKASLETAKAFQKRIGNKYGKTYIVEIKILKEAENVSE